MGKVSVALAKLAGIRKAVEAILEHNASVPHFVYFEVEEVGHYFSGAQNQLIVLREELPDLYGDFVDSPTSPAVEMSKHSEHDEAKWQYSQTQLHRLTCDIDHIFEIRANSELAPPAQRTVPMRCVFISHGRAPDWREVQAYIEKDIALNTLDLAQEADQGRTILGKLRCDSAVIVMTVTTWTPAVRRERERTLSMRSVSSKASMVCRASASSMRKA